MSGGGAENPRDDLALGKFWRRKEIWTKGAQAREHVGHVVKRQGTDFRAMPCRASASTAAGARHGRQASITFWPSTEVDGGKGGVNERRDKQAK